MPFDSLFKEGKTLMKIRCYGLTVEASVHYVPYPIKDFLGKDLQVQQDGDTLVILGVY